MMHASQQRKAGVGMAVGALIFGSAFGISCQPGDLPCDQSTEWRALCDQPAGGMGGTAAPTTPAGGSGGSSTTPPPAAAVTATTPVMGCNEFKTVGAMDAFFATRCGVNSTCHGTGAVWTPMPAQNVFERFKADKAKFSCMGAPLANGTNWRESVLWTKTTMSPAACPPGSTNPGLTMPPQMGFDPKMPVLTGPEIACLEGYLKAITGK